MLGGAINDINNVIFEYQLIVQNNTQSVEYQDKGKTLFCQSKRINIGHCAY
jgi:hypothetical protein